MKMVDLFRIKLQAIHKAESVPVSFPRMHFLIEELDEGFLATCVEYTQTYQAAKIDDAIAGLIDNMYDYFFTTIRVLGRNALHEKAADSASNQIWDEIRKNISLKNDLDLEYIQKVFNKEDFSDLKEQILDQEKHQSNSGNRGHISLTEHNEILKEREEKIKRLQAEIIILLKKYELMDRGIEGTEEWIKDLDKLGINESALLAGII